MAQPEPRTAETVGETNVRMTRWRNYFSQDARFYLTTVKQRHNISPLSVTRSRLYGVGNGSFTVNDEVAGSRSVIPADGEGGGYFFGETDRRR